MLLYLLMLSIAERVRARSSKIASLPPLLQPDGFLHVRTFFHHDSRQNFA